MSTMVTETAIDRTALGTQVLSVPPRPSLVSLTPGEIADQLSVARSLFSVPVSYIHHPMFADPTTHEAILRGPTESSVPTKEPSRAKSIAPKHTGGVHLPQAPLLSREQEQALFLRYNLLRFQQYDLQQRYKDTTPPESVLTEFEDLAAAAEADRNRLIEANTRLIVSVAKKYLVPQNSLEELTSEGLAPMVRAIDKFDCSRGFKFSTYATWALKRHFFRHRQLEHRHALRYTQARIVEDIGPTEHAQPPKDNDSVAALNKRLDSIIASCLDEREQRIVRERFGLGGEGEGGKTLKDVGLGLGLTKERVRQLEVRALHKLRIALGAASELADLLSDDVVGQWRSARESDKRQQTMTLCATLLLASPLRSGGQVSLANLVDWVDLLPDSEECVDLLIPALQDLENRDAVETKRTDSGLTYALSRSALKYLGSLSSGLSRRKLQSTLEYLEVVPGLRATNRSRT